LGGAPPPATLLSALVTNGQFSLSFETVARQSYTVQENTDLSITNWVTVTNFLGTHHLMKQPQRIRLAVQASLAGQEGGGSIKSSNT
jgi:hypothetical protein